MTKLVHLLAAVVAAAIGTAISPALAQTALQRFGENAAADRVPTYFMTDVAGNRKQREFDSIPIRIGNFFIHPTVQLNFNYDGNWINRSDTADLATGIIGALPELTTRFGHNLAPALLQQITLLNVNPHVADHSDREFDFDPGVSVRTEWDDNSLSFDVGGRFYHYARLRREDRTEWHSTLIGVIALGEKHDLTLVAGADSRAELPGSNGTAVLDYYGFGPSIHTSPTTSANLNLRFGRVLGLITVAYTRDYYSTLQLRTADLLNNAGVAAAKLKPQQTISQDYRNDQNPQVLANLSYDLSTETQVFVQTSYQYVNELSPPRDKSSNLAHPFDSDTFGFLLGAAQSLNRLVVYQFGVGYQFHHYRDPYYQDTRRIYAEGALDWYPTQLLSFRAQIAQSYIGSAVVGVGDIAVRTLQLRADYEFRPNIEVFALWSREWDHYPINAATAATTTAASATSTDSVNFEIDYRPNRLLEIGVNCGFHDRASNDAIVLGAFTAFRTGLTITLRH